MCTMQHYKFFHASFLPVIRLTRINLSNEYGSDSPELLEFEDLLGRTKYSTGVSTYNATAGIRVVRGPLPEHIASGSNIFIIFSE